MVEVDNGGVGKEFLEMAFKNCIKCSNCKYGYKNFEPSCPSGEKFKFESYWASGRIGLIRGIIRGDLEWNDDLKKSIFACTTCGACMDSCQAPHSGYIVEMIEALRELTVKNIGPAVNQELLKSRCLDKFNPYGEINSNNEDLKRKYQLPNEAEWVYFIGCTSNYRQQNLRDSTIRFLKKVGINFTLIDEHCCTSPLIRTGQVDLVDEYANYNIDQIKGIGATKLVTSCAGCYKTYSNDFKKFAVESNLEIFHISELIFDLLNSKKIKFISSFPKTITYHDPCHLGRHMGIYEIPREILKQIPGITLNEMKRNRNFAWCCGAGGGVKIAYPDWSLEICKQRLDEAEKTDATIITSTCPFCKTNFSDAKDKYGFKLEILDLIEIIDQIELIKTE